jgi:sporulation protein YlmC with PRC-barrel domain
VVSSLSVDVIDGRILSSTTYGGVTQMLKQLAYAGLIAAALAAPPVMAQTAGGQTPTPDKMAPAAPPAPNAATPAPSPAPADKSTPAPSASTAKPSNDTTVSAAKPSGDSFVTQQDMDQWRGSKLVGVSVYGPDQKKVGSIKDILMDHDGNAKVIVISVGGFLGIGSKDVGVPFKAMQWRTEGRAAATNPPPASSSGSGNGMSPGQSAAGAQPTTDPKEVEASQGYPDMGVIAMTEQQLKAAPEFHYASDKSAKQ